MRRALVRILLAVLATVVAAALVLTAMVLTPRSMPEVPALEVPEIAQPTAFRDQKVSEATASGVRPENTERLVLHRTSGSDVVFLYVHGFSASRGEGELVVDALAQEWSANAWYMRLPGHGGPGEALGEVEATEFLEEVTEALGMAEALGEKTVLVATSTGASLATWAAATHPDKVDALVLASPLYQYVDPLARRLLSSAFAHTFVQWVLGPERSWEWNDPRKGPGHAGRWMQRYPSSVLVELDDVRRFAADPATQARVTQPVLLFSYYADDANQDSTVDVAESEAAFARMNGGSPHPASKAVRIADGNHVLFSEHIRTDKETILKETRQFLREVVGPSPRELKLEAATTP